MIFYNVFFLHLIGALLMPYAFSSLGLDQPLSKSYFFSETAEIAAKPFDIQEFAWLQGHWIGDGFGGTAEETWSAPSPEGNMMGAFRHHSADGTLNFYEFFVLDQTGIRLKHFSADLNGWEDKEKYVTFKMIAVSPGKIEFEGLVYEKKSEDEMEIRLQMKTEEGIQTEIFKMKKM